MEWNKKEAIRSKSIAEKKMLNKDFSGARKVALKAQQLFPDLENVSHMLAVCEVHCSAEVKVNGETDWYKILQVAPTSDELTIKKQCLKLAFLLLPDENKFAGAEAAFKLEEEARRILTDQSERQLHDMKLVKVDEKSGTANDGKFEKVKLSEVNRKEEAMKASVRNRSQKKGRNVGTAGSSPQRSTMQKHDISSNEVTSDKSSADASMLFRINSKLLRRLVDLSVEKIQDIVAEADAAGQADLSDKLVPLYALVEELHSSRRGDPQIALIELQKAQKADVQFRTEQEKIDKSLTAAKFKQEEIDKSLTAAKFKVAELEAAQAQAKDEVVELGRRQSTLVPVDPQFIQKLRREVIKQEMLDRISSAKVVLLEAEYKKRLLYLE